MEMDGGVTDGAVSIGGRYGEATTSPVNFSQNLEHRIYNFSVRRLVGTYQLLVLISATLQADPSRRSRYRCDSGVRASLRQRHLQLSSGGTTSIACEHTLGLGLGLGRPGALLGWRPGWTWGWSGASS